MGGGNQSQSQTSGPSWQQRKAQGFQMDASSPVLALVAQQLMEALRTGGVGAQVPIAQRAVEAGRHATATTSQNTSDALTRSGITGPFARQVQAGVEQKGDFDVSQIMPQMMQMLLQMAPDFGLMRGSPIWGTPVSSGKSGGWNFSI